MNDFVDFNLAKKLKEKGYPQKNCFQCYFVGDDKVRGCSVGDVIHRSHKGEKHLIAAPTISQVLKWLREEKGIDILVHRGHISINNKREVTRHYCANVYFIDRFACTIDNDEQDFSTYEEATLAGIKYTLDHLI